MASEMIQSILKTEEDCKTREAEARKKAEARKQQAKDDAAALISEAHKQVDSMVNNDAAAIASSAQRRLDKQKQKFSGECKSLSDKAAKNIGKVTEQVIAALTE